jgi:hypothetical protein
MWSLARQAYCLGLIPSFFIRERRVVRLMPNNAATPSDEITVEAISAARFVLFGGEPLDGPRHFWCVRGGESRFMFWFAKRLIERLV